MQNKQIIPDGWMVRTVKQFGKVVSGGTPDTNNCSFWGGDIFWLTPSEVSSLQNRYIYRTKRTITKGGLDNSSAMLLPKNSLILCTRATIGDCCINAVEMCTNQGFKNIIVNKDNNVEFLYYLVLKNKNELLRKACGSTFLEISKKDVEKLKFVVPPLEEQEKIAQILATWDSAIEQLTDLIAEKQHQKKALMQRLLTGKQRLPGFNKPWIEAELSDIITYEQPTKYLVTEVCKDGTDAVPVLTANKSFIVGYTKDKHGIYNKGICIIFDDFTTEVQYVNFAFKVKSSAIKILVKRSEQINLKFVYEQIKRIKRHIGGHKRYYLSEFQYNTIFLPELSEQKAIADVLMAADAEIDLLQQQLQAITEQKQGLMQQLLTGNIRVKIDKKS